MDQVYTMQVRILVDFGKFVAIVIEIDSAFSEPLQSLFACPRLRTRVRLVLVEKHKDTEASKVKDDKVLGGPANLFPGLQAKR